MVAGLFAALGWWTQAYRDHARWLREKRYEAYTRFLSVGYELADVWREVSAAQGDVDRASTEQAEIAAELSGVVDAQRVADLGLRISSLQERVSVAKAANVARAERIRDLSRRAIEESVRFTLLGPGTVHRATEDFLSATEDDARHSALTNLEASMRKPLRIDYARRGSLLRVE
jgi:hypothetical protein